MNTKLLRRVRAKILRNPKELNMGRFFCGSAACIAGWAICLSDKKSPRTARAKEHGVIDHKASMLLGISWIDDSAKLFFVSHWPRKFSRAYDSARSHTARAKVAAKRIDYFIKHKL